MIFARRASQLGGGTRDTRPHFAHSRRRAHGRDRHRLLVEQRLVDRQRGGYGRGPRHDPGGRAGKPERDHSSRLDVKRRDRVDRVG